MEPRARILVGLCLLGVASIWALALYAYATLPEEIPTHFTINGQPNDFGTKSIFMLMPIIFMIAPSIMLLVVRYRFVLINKYPYLVNLPAFYVRMDALPMEERSLWINRYFELMLGVCMFVVAFEIAIFWAIYEGTIAGSMNPWFIVGLIALDPIILIVLFYYIYKIDDDLRRRTGFSY